MPLMIVKGIKKQFSGTRKVNAVNMVSLSIETGQTLGLVGESGCGKTTLARILTNLEKPTAGEAIMDGDSVFSMSRRQTSEKIRMIFQSPAAALNPQMKIVDIIKEAIGVHEKDIARKERTDYAKELLRRVNYSNSVRKYPHQLSGGEKRRVAIARAILVGSPKLIIADEPVSALDVHIQIKIMDLLATLQAERKVACLFISHDLNMVEYMSHRIAVMFLGRIVEIGSRDEIINNALHPYTKRLLSAMLPIGEAAKRRLKAIAGYLSWAPTDDVQEDGTVDIGCCYRSRCEMYRDSSIPSHSKAECKMGSELHRVGQSIDHKVACHLALLKH